MDREYFLIGVQDDLYAIQDSLDNSIDIVTYKQMISLLTLGFNIKGVDSAPASELRQMSSPTFTFKDTYFPVEEYTDEDESNEEDELLFDDYDEAVSEVPEVEEEDLYEDYTDESVYEEDEVEDTDDGYDPYIDLEEDEVGDTSIKRLYTYLTPEQAKVLKSYIMWRAREVFRVTDASDNFEFSNPKKEAKLQKYREGGEYYYAGMIDTGYSGGGRCTLGHELRYVHLAIDMTQYDCDIDTLLDRYNYDFEQLLDSPNALVFGKGCVAEFFKVGEGSINALGRAQTESLCDMKELCDFYDRGIIDEVRNSFGVLDDVMQSVSSKALFNKQGTERVQKGHIYFYKKFRELNLPYPRSLVLGIRDDLLCWRYHKFTFRTYQFTDKDSLRSAYSYIYPTVARNLLEADNRMKDDFIFKGFPSYKSVSHLGDSKLQLRAYLDMFMRCKICGKYMYTYDGNSLDAAEGGRSKDMKQHWDAFNRCANNFLKDDKDKYSTRYLKRLDNYMLQSLKFMDDIDAFAKSLKRYVWCEDLVSCKEVNFSGLADLLDYIKSEGRYNGSTKKALSGFYEFAVKRGLLSDTFYHYVYSTRPGVFSFANSLNESVHLLNIDIADFNAGRIQSNLKQYLADRDKEILAESAIRQQKLAAIDKKVRGILNKPSGTEVVVGDNGCTDSDVVNIIKFLFEDNDLVDKLKSTDIKAHSVCETVLQGGSYSIYQQPWVLRACEIMTNLKFIDSRTKEILLKVDFILAHADKFGRYSKTQLVLDISKTIKETHRASDKQLYYIETGLTKLSEKGYAYTPIQS